MRSTGKPREQILPWTPCTCLETPRFSSLSTLSQPHKFERFKELTANSLMNTSTLESKTSVWVCLSEIGSEEDGVKGELS